MKNNENTLKDIYAKLVKDSQYFDINSYTITPMTDEFFNKNNQVSGRIIEDIFSKRLKSNVLGYFKESNIFEFYEKSDHAVSLYFLGLSLHEIIENPIKEFIKQINESEGKISKNQFKEESKGFTFDYIWFLTSLFHDISSEYEPNIVNYLSFSCLDPIEKDINRRLKDYNLKYTIYKESHEEKRILNTKPKYSWKTFTYKEKTVKEYYRKRISDQKSFDHGIVAGYIFYDSIIKNYLYYLDQREIRDFSEIFYASSDRNIMLRFHPQQINIFRLVADAIISHNIWHDPAATNPQLKEDNKFSLNTNPLVFYLGLLDTIEPLKFFVNDEHKFERNEVLSDIIVDHTGNEISLTMDQDFYSKSCKEILNKDKNYYDSWLQKIKGLETWLNVKVENEDEKIAIKIN